MTRYTKEESGILRRCKVKEVYDYIKEAIDTFTIAEIELCIRNMDKRANYETNPEQRRIYKTIIGELKDLQLLRMNEMFDDLELTSIYNEYQELESKVNLTQLDIRRKKKLRKLLQDANEVDAYENDKTTDDEVSDYDLIQYYDWE